MDVIISGAEFAFTLNCIHSFLKKTKCIVKQTALGLASLWSLCPFFIKALQTLKGTPHFGNSLIALSLVFLKSRLLEYQMAVGDVVSCDEKW